LIAGRVTDAPIDGRRTVGVAHAFNATIGIRITDRLGARTVRHCRALDTISRTGTGRTRCNAVGVRDTFKAEIFGRTANRGGREASSIAGHDGRFAGSSSQMEIGFGTCRGACNCPSLTGTT